MAHYADNVIILEAGGSLAHFESSTEWLSRNPPKETMPDDTELVETVTKQTESSRVVKKLKDEDPDQRVKRQIGDTAVWVYYAKLSGPWHVLLLVLLTVIGIFCMQFPSKSNYHDSFQINIPRFNAS
jgi:hypothetical protein